MGRRGLAIIYALKNIITQVLIAGSFAFLFPLTLDKYVRTLRRKKKLGSAGFEFVIIISSAFSILLCSVFSTTLLQLIPLNLGILPLFIGMLYGGYKSGLPLAGLYLLCDFYFNEKWSFSGLFLHTGLLFYPLLVWMSPSFRKGTLTDKVNKLWMCLLPAMLLVTASPIIEDPALNLSNAGPLLLLMFYIMVSVFVGGALIYVIEFALEKLLLKEQIKGISEKYLREEEKLQQVMDVAPLCMVSVDTDGNVTSINEMMMNLFKTRMPELNKNDILGRPLGSFVDITEKDYISYRIAQALKGVKMNKELIRIGSQIHYTSTSPLTNTFTGEILGAVLVIQDITELERLRSELGNVERLSLVGQMAASITHEIRNPMAVVRGFLQLMKEKSPESLDHYYRIVMEELDRANGIINDFLSLAQNRISEKEQWHLHQIINDLSPLLWADANLRGQTIELVLDENVPKLNLNAKEIKQMLLNLARNGMEAMEEKGKLSIQTRLKKKEQIVELVIRDTGVGMSKSRQERLFEPFFTTKAKGTGLGLALCLSIVERHGGKIMVESEEGQGTTFVIQLPLVES
ncbi:two-component system sensor histidine kinase NtrB [Paenibacillus chibensis]|uniref:two-component system sensor histidine kinase NtrB n=1 Tax=Paenibacillus chibensis TaxID=59846 RepID=UPI001FE3C6CD|nr:ATP-binding protein [Paenibacillus chibensis]MEC0368524.1 ATP-binding protein [Paenibacillus chibensis]